MNVLITAIFHTQRARTVIVDALGGVSVRAAFAELARAWVPPNELIQFESALHGSHGDEINSRWSQDTELILRFDTDEAHSVQADQLRDRLLKTAPNLAEISFSVWLLVGCASPQHRYARHVPDEP